MFATLTDINGKEWEYASSTKFLIKDMLASKDRGEKTLHKIAEGNEALSLLGLDMDLWNEGSTILDTMEVPDMPCHLILKFNQNKINASRQCDILSNKPSIINQFKLKANLFNLACNTIEYRKHDNKGLKIPNYICYKKSGDENLLRDWNSSNLTLCYISKFGENIKNNPKSDFAKSCSNKGPGRHGIEFRVFATRVGFKIFKKEGRYQITYRVDVIIGFSFSEYTIKFGKIISAAGKYLKDGFLWPIEISPIILSISIGNSENKFAVLIDELNNVVYDYGRAVLANFGEKNIKEILNKVLEF
uniref:Uncharacterized protein n=1 Tax=Meloidogyne enterolobii TaxID=390850 RepID=A0A6V7UC07_MELEN|nr:unnamed protein product [Meloidogyne enterolobii]